LIYPLVLQADPTAPPSDFTPFYWLQFGLLGLFFLMLITGKGLMTTQRHAEVIAEKNERMAEVRADRDEWKAAYMAEREAREKESDARGMAEIRAEAAIEAAKTGAKALDALRQELGRRP
jgi:hypothetical protein